MVSADGRPARRCGCGGRDDPCFRRQGRDIAPVCNVLSRFAVPLFIMLSAFGHGGEDQDISAPLGLFGRRMKRILPPFVLWSALYLVVEAMFGKPHARPLWDLVSGGAYIHLYFIIVLIQLEILYVPLYRAVRRAPNLTLAASAVITLVMQLVICGERMELWTLPERAALYADLCAIPAVLCRRAVDAPAGQAAVRGSLPGACRRVACLCRERGAGDMGRGALPGAGQPVPAA